VVVVFVFVTFFSGYGDKLDFLRLTLLLVLIIFDEHIFSSHCLLLSAVR
jgi:hypothetical protein